MGETMNTVVENETSSDELERVLAAAEVAKAQMGTSTLVERSNWLGSVADALDAAAAELIGLAARETHLTEGRLTGELTRTTFQLRLFASVVTEGAFLQATIDHADPAWPMGPRPDLRRTMRAFGPVAVYAASNFPFAFSVAGGDTASAIAAGCPVIVKANPGHPELSRRTAAIVSQALTSAGAPDGAFALVEGFDTGRRLVIDSRITAASFTGSVKGGRALYDLAVSRPDPIPFFGELGSLNPAFVTAGAAAERAESIAIGFIDSITLGSGQFCTKPGLLFVPADSAIAELAATAAADRAGQPLLNEHIREGYDHVLSALSDHPAVNVLVGPAGPAESAPAPTVLATTVELLLANRDELLTECFGPTALIVTYSSADELLSAAAAFEGQLTATVHGEPGEAVLTELVELLADRAGRVLFGGWPTGVSVTYAMHHGGPYPATTSPHFTSVGTTAIDRFLRPVSYQSTPEALLPEQLHDANPLGVPQRVDGEMRV